MSLHLLKAGVAQQVLDILKVQDLDVGTSCKVILVLLHKEVTVERGFLTSTQTGLVELAVAVLCADRLTCLASTVVRLEPVVGTRRSQLPGRTHPERVYICSC